MKIAHLAAYANRNAGDSALQYGLRRVLREDWPEELEFTSIHVVRALDYLDEINRHDLCLIGGGGLISPGGPACSGCERTSSGWMVPFTPGHLRTIKVPIVVYGVGHNLFPGQEPLNLGPVEAMREAAVAFSVRNDGSAKRLGWDVDIVPDPGMWIEADETDERYDVVLQLAGNLLKERVGNVELFLDRMRELIGTLLEQGLSVIAVSHIAKDDPYVKLCKDWGAAIRLADERRDLPNIRRFFGVYKNARCVVAMRGHAQICAYGLNVPFLSIITQDKNEGFVDSTAYRCLCGYGDNFSRKPLDEVGEYLEGIGQLGCEAGPRHKLRTYREWAREYHEKIWGALQNV